MIQIFCSRENRSSQKDFIGSTCFYEYYIDADAMHAGKNFGRLCFELPDQSFLYTVTASSKEREEEREVSEHREAGPGADRTYAALY